MATSANHSWSVLNASDEYQTRSVLDGSDEVKECEPCQKAGNTADATKYCTDCSEYLCRKCSTSHTMFKAFQRHVLKDVNRPQCEPCQKGGKRTRKAVKNCTNCSEKMCKKCSKLHVRFKAFQHHVIQDMETVSPVTTGSSTDVSSKCISKIAELRISHDETQQRSVYGKSNSRVFRKVTAKLVSTIDITTANDVIKPTMHFGGLTVVQRFYCVVRDMHERYMRVIDTRNAHVTSEVELSSVDNLMALTSVNDDQVAVATFKKIFFLSVSSSGIISKPHHSIDVNVFCGIYNITLCKDRFYVTTGDVGINVINMQGQTIMKIDKLFENRAMGIAASNDHNTIYVCNYDTVCSIDLNGKVKATYKDENLKSTEAVTVDGEGYVYVYCSGTRSVHRLSADLSMGQVIITDVDYVDSCAFNKTDNRLYLGRRSEIKVYDV